MSFFKVNLLDLIPVAYLLFGWWRGRRRGFGVELPSAAGWFVLFITGCGLFRWTDHLLTGTGRMTGMSVGVFGSLTIAIGAYLIVRQFRKSLRRWALQSCAARSAEFGAITGLLRTAFIFSTVVLMLLALPVGFVDWPFVKGSFFCRNLAQFILPIYQAVH